MRRGAGERGQPPAAAPAALAPPASPAPVAPGTLYVVATPIGTLGDLSPRAAGVLAQVALIVAEDTRRLRPLLTHFRIGTPTRSLHDHNESRVVPSLLAALKAGASIALVSDAGTPLVCDPGYRLVRACREATIPVRCVPGPSAITAALSVAGLPPHPFTFVGFLPPSPAARRRTLAAYGSLPHTLVLFLSPHRLGVELAACAEGLGPTREAVLLAELSKLHERAERGTLEALARGSSARTPRGEYTLVVAPPPAPAPRAVTGEEAARAVEAALATGLSPAEARRLVAQRLGLSRRELYALLHRPR
ncbi:MAG: 16S rRNA (cytidine(1402)-2'-O)-methyltransferase [Thermoanaerobaculaceae bacterium]|nr:16S rRNA (cytidine(1402)-2'-O)-methyltransferase [Thermoanaerobaculaceae bacterium]